VEELFLQFAKKASSFNSWLEDAEEDLTDSVRCNSMEEIRVSGGKERKLRKLEGSHVSIYLCRVFERRTLSSRHH